MYFRVVKYVKKIDGSDVYDEGVSFNPFKEGYRLCKIAAAYAQRIDWLVSGDDGEECFHERLKDDLEGLIQLDK